MKMKLLDYAVLLLAAVIGTAILLQAVNTPARHDRAVGFGVLSHDPSEYQPQPLSRREKDERNTSQTGVHDVQIPIEVRREYARKHGIAEPTR